MGDLGFQPIRLKAQPQQLTLFFFISTGDLIFNAFQKQHQVMILFSSPNPYVNIISVLRYNKYDHNIP